MQNYLELQLRNDYCWRYMKDLMYKFYKKVRFYKKLEKISLRSGTSITGNTNDINMIKMVK